MSDGQHFFVVSAQAASMFGEVFSVGYVVIDELGREWQHGYHACPQERAYGIPGGPAGRGWVVEHVLDHLPEPELRTPGEVRNAFWADWSEWQKMGSIFVADTPWPTISGLVSTCVTEDPRRIVEAPIPTLDVCSARWAVGLPPTSEEPREGKGEELPEYNPLADARYTARLLLEAMVCMGATMSEVAMGMEDRLEKGSGPAPCRCLELVPVSPGEMARDGAGAPHHPECPKLGKEEEDAENRG